MTYPGNNNSEEWYIDVFANPVSCCLTPVDPARQMRAVPPDMETRKVLMRVIAQ